MAREAVRQGQPDFFAAVSEVMFRHDLIGINYGDKTAEHAADAGTVTRMSPD